MTAISEGADFSIIALGSFVQATRDSGYKGTPSAVAELVDNSLQAGAQRIQIDVYDSGQDTRHPLCLSVLDDGQGMDPFTLRTSLRFGGSSRFNDRDGMGRYGMGLPNSSFSQARHVSVYSWREPEAVYHSSLDLDLIAKGELGHVPAPSMRAHDKAGASPTGTLVIWSRCDRLDNKRPATTARKLAAALGRRFRHFIWRGVEIIINGRPVQGVDPLYLHPSSVFTGASRFDEPLKYEVEVPAEYDGAGQIGIVTVQFSELPVHEWHGLTNKEKRQRGIAKGAGVSVVRAGREVDYGWFFMGAKRRENYDDWWRCEVCFDPVLDEAFGITHTKQQVRPHRTVLEAIVPEIEQIARVLNSRARSAHLALKLARRSDSATETAMSTEGALEPLPSAPKTPLLSTLERRLPHLRDARAPEERLRYSVVHAAVSEQAFFTFARDDERLVLVLNPEHAFYRRVYKPIADAAESAGTAVREALDLTLIAAARAEAAAGPDAAVIEQFRAAWSDTLAAYFSR